MAPSVSDICTLFAREGGREYDAALPFLRGSFDATVLEPIRLHVQAKRYPCATRAGCCNTLSAESRRSLGLQGGPYDEAEAAAFIARPYAADAVQVRPWDDLAKVRGAATPALAHFLAVLETAASG